MHHHVAHALPRTLLFHTWSEAQVLWSFLTTRVPSIDALVLMPDHLLTVVDNRRSFGLALRAYARWRNTRRSAVGHVFAPVPDAHPLATADKVFRSERYIHLNPCRAALVGDPLSWPYSTYRDAVGLTAAPIRPPDADPASTHMYTSSDPSVTERGTMLPVSQVSTPTLVEVFDAVGGLLRATTADLHRPGPARNLLLRASRVLTTATVAEIADLAEVDRRTVQRLPTQNDVLVRLVQRVCGDPRFSALDPGDVRLLPRWQRYRSWG